MSIVAAEKSLNGRHNRMVAQHKPASCRNVGAHLGRKDSNAPDAELPLSVSRQKGERYDFQLCKRELLLVIDGIDMDRRRPHEQLSEFLCCASRRRWGSSRFRTSPAMAAAYLTFGRAFIS